MTVSYSHPSLLWHIPTWWECDWWEFAGRPSSLSSLFTLKSLCRCRIRPEGGAHHQCHHYHHHYLHHRHWHNFENMKERIRSRPWRVMEKVWEDLGDWDGKPSFKLWAWWWWWWWWFPLCLWTVTERLYTTGWDGTGRELWTTAFTIWFFPSNQIINQNPMCNFLNFFSYYPLFSLCIIKAF